MQYLGLLEFLVSICDALHITTHTRYLMSMIAILSLDFLLLSGVYMYFTECIT